MFDFKILPAGDSALVVEFGETMDRRLSEVVLALAHSVERAHIEGLVETVPTFRSLMICFDPQAIARAALERMLEGLVRGTNVDAAPGKLWRLPICYHRDFALDLDQVARSSDLTTDEVVARHSASVNHVYMLGFLPGQPYLGDLPPELELPRHQSPRPMVAAGSVGIAGKMTCVFPRETPCGLNIIGRSPVTLWNPARQPEALLAPGDRVLFEPISIGRFEILADRAARGHFDAGDFSAPLGEAA